MVTFIGLSTDSWALSIQEVSEEVSRCSLEIVQTATESYIRNTMSFLIRPINN